MAKDAVSEHSDHDSSAHLVSEREDVPRLQEEPSHERWRVLDENPAGSNASSSSAALDTGLAIDAAPIVGIALQDDARPPIRPRFKTLLGVPRNHPDLDLYADHPLLNTALLEAEARGAAEGSSRQDAALEAGRPGATPSSETADGREPCAADPPETLENAAAREARAEQAAATTDTALPIEKFSSTVRLPREARGPFAAIAPGSFDLRAEVAALRGRRGPRAWLLAIGGGCAAAVLAFYLPREWRMLPSSPAALRQDDAALLVTSWQATQTLESLRPTSRTRASAPTSAPASPAFRATTAADVAAARQPEAKQSSKLEQREGAEKQTGAAGSSPPAGSHVASASSPWSGSTEHAPALSGSGKSARTPSAKAPHAAHAHAAPRQVIAGGRGRALNAAHAERDAHEQVRMKALEARQNPPRNAGGNGIIRDTPF